MKKFAIQFSFLLLSVCGTGALYAQYISTIAGTGTAGYSGNGGLATSARLSALTAVAFDGSGNLYIADKNNHVIRKINTSGIISTIAGTGIAGYTGDGGVATAARLNNPFGIAVDRSGNIYVADNGNNVIRKVTTGGVISTVAGTGAAAYSGDSGPAIAATLSSPMGITINDSGWLYIADAGNHVVRRVDRDGVITTIAGTGAIGYSGNGGPATIATFYRPAGVTTDVFGNIYIADQLNHAVRKINSAGIITTIAGNGMPGASGDGGNAAASRLSLPSSVSVDAWRSIYIADEGNNTIRRIDSNGNISRFAGSYAAGYLGDGGLAVNAQLSSPKSVLADGWGRVYIADHSNHVLRMVGTGAVSSVASVSHNDMAVVPNPSSGIFTVELPAAALPVALQVTDVAGRTIAVFNATGRLTKVDLKGQPAGTYFIKAGAGSGVRVIVQ